VFGLNPWAIVIAGGIWIGSTLGAYFYGHNEGWNAALADQAAGIQKALTDFETRVAASADAATQSALEEFRRKTAVLDKLGDQMATAQGKIDAAAAKLSSSLRGGACVLQPAQRRLLECIRRPDGPGCSPGDAAVRPAISGTGAAAAAPARSR
jgi:hypothetical protein